MDKVCNICKISQPISNFYKSKTNKGGHRTLCKKCCNKITIEYWKKNKERYYKNTNLDRQKNRKKWALYARKARQKNRLLAFKIIANGKKIECCKSKEWNCCKDSTNLNYLTLDHINGDGFKHRRNLIKTTSNWMGANDTYTWIKRNPELALTKFQIICMNANMLKAKQNNEYKKKY